MVRNQVNLFSLLIGQVDFLKTWTGRGGGGVVGLLTSSRTTIFASIIF